MQEQKHISMEHSEKQVGHLQEKRRKRPRNNKYCDLYINKDTFTVIIGNTNRLSPFLLYEEINSKSALKELKKIKQWLDEVINYLESLDK